MVRVGQVNSMPKRLASILAWRQMLDEDTLQDIFRHAHLIQVLWSETLEAQANRWCIHVPFQMLQAKAILKTSNV